MTTKEYLGQIERLDKMIENKLNEIYRLKQMAFNITSRCDRERVQSGSSHDKIGDGIAQLVDLESETDALVESYVNKRRMIVGQIDKINNMRYYAVLTDRFVNKMEFKEIFLKMGISERTLTSIYGNALKEFEKMYGESYLND